MAGRGRQRMRPYDRARECWEKIEEEEGRGAGWPTFIDVESGAGPCMHLARSRGLLNPGGNRSTEIMAMQHRYLCTA